MPYACPTIAILPSLTIIVVHTHSYTASITVAKAFTAVMAANMLNDVTDDGQVVGVPGEEGLVTFNFMMPQPIPVYLVALAVGDLRCASIGPRSRVWSEPGIIEAATKEFQGVRSGLVVARLSSYPDLTGRCSCVCVPCGLVFHVWWSVVPPPRWMSDHGEVPGGWRVIVWQVPLGRVRSVGHASMLPVSHACRCYAPCGGSCFTRTDFLGCVVALSFQTQLWWHGEPALDVRDSLPVGRRSVSC